jgi:hypothetical protein
MNNKLEKLFGLFLQLLGRILYLVSVGILLLTFLVVKYSHSSIYIGDLWKIIVAILLIVISFSAILLIGRQLTLLGKKLVAQSQNIDLVKELENPNYHPVLYMRPFNEDYKTSQTNSITIVNFTIDMLSSEEEQLSKAVSNIGPMVAIGIPGEKLPTLGAQRLYSDDDSWKQLISKIMLRSKLILLKIGNTEGFRWEIGHSLQNARPEQVVFLIPNDKNIYDNFCIELSKFINHKLPDFKYGFNNNMTIQSILYFTSNWEPHYVRLRSFYFRKSRLNPLISIIRLALKPVYEQLGVRWKRQHILFSLYFILVLFIILIGFSFSIPSIMTYTTSSERLITQIIIYSISIFLFAMMVLVFCGYRNQNKKYMKYEKTLSNKANVQQEFLDTLEYLLELYFINCIQNKAFANPANQTYEELFNSKTTDFYELSYKTDLDIEQIINKIQKFITNNNAEIVSSDAENILIIIKNKNPYKMYITNFKIKKTETLSTSIIISVMMKSMGAKKAAENIKTFVA